MKARDWLLEVFRFGDTGQECVGRFRLTNLAEGKVVLEGYTMERPWKDNTRNVSCIPPGQYAVVPSYFYSGGYACLEVDGVPGRSLIKWHSANMAHQLEGCFAPGRRLGYLGRFKRLAVLDSMRTLKKLLEFIGESGARLVVYGART